MVCLPRLFSPLLSVCHLLTHPLGLSFQVDMPISTCIGQMPFLCAPIAPCISVPWYLRLYCSCLVTSL